MGMRIVNYGIIGCGFISKVHIEALKEIPNARLVAVSDVFRPNLDRVVEAEKVRGYHNYQELLQDKDVDAVLILTSSGTHSEIGMEAARAKKHVIVEKPIDTTEEKARLLIDVCRGEKVLLSCIFQHRFDPAVAAVKEAIQNGWLGKITSCVCRTTWYRDQEYYDHADWRGTLRYDGGGALINQSIHYIDLMQYLLGMPAQIFGYTATLAHERIETEDVGVAAVRFPGGCLGLIEGTTSAYPGMPSSLGIYGDAGSILLEGDEIRYCNLKNGKVCEILTVEEGSAHRKQLQDITDAIEKKHMPKVTGEEALNALRIVRAIYTSAEECRPIDLQ